MLVKIHNMPTYSHKGIPITVIIASSAIIGIANKAIAKTSGMRMHTSMKYYYGWHWWSSHLIQDLPNRLLRSSKYWQVSFFSWRSLWFTTLRYFLHISRHRIRICQKQQRSGYLHHKFSVCSFDLPSSKQLYHSRQIQYM